MDPKAIDAELAKPEHWIELPAFVRDEKNRGKVAFFRAQMALYVQLAKEAIRRSRARSASSCRSTCC